MLNFSLIADKCSHSLITKRIVNCIKENIIEYDLEKLKYYVDLYGNDKTIKDKK